MMLRSNLVLLPLDDEVVVFSEETQSLIALNAGAALVLRKAQSGLPAWVIEKELIAQGLASEEEAPRWLTCLQEALGAHGLLANSVAPTPDGMPDLWDEERYLKRMGREMPAYAPMEVVAQQRYRLLNTCALIRFAHEAQVRLVNAVIGHFAYDGTDNPTVTLDLHGSFTEQGKHLRTDIYRDGQPIAYAPRLSRLAPLVKGCFWSTAINAYNFLFYLHAGVVGTGDTCVLLPGAPGSGKSSLTAALTHHGFRYFSDEVALVEAGTYRVVPTPLAFCIKDTAWDLMTKYLPEVLVVPTHGRDDGKIVRYVPPPADRVATAGAQVSHIIFPRYQPGIHTTINRIARADALRRLMAECLALRERLTTQSVGDLLRWISEIHCYEVMFSSLEEAVAVIVKVTQAPPR